MAEGLVGWTLVGVNPVGFAHPPWPLPMQWPRGSCHMGRWTWVDVHKHLGDASVCIGHAHGLWVCAHADEVSVYMHTWSMHMTCIHVHVKAKYPAVKVKYAAVRSSGPLKQADWPSLAVHLA